LTDCFEEIAVTPDKVAYSLRSRTPDARHPDIATEDPIEPAVWQGLVDALDASAFASLPSTIGQPDAADEGAEFVEIATPQGQKRVTFSAGASIPQLAALLERLRPIVRERSQKSRRV
jgi:hypothetical protein